MQHPIRIPLVFFTNEIGFIKNVYKELEMTTIIFINKMGNERRKNRREKFH